MPIVRRWKYASVPRSDRSKPHSVRSGRVTWNVHANKSQCLKHSRERVAVPGIFARPCCGTNSGENSECNERNSSIERVTILDPPRSYARWGRSVLRTADAAAHRNRETVKAFQHGRPGESDHGPAARLMYFLRGTVEIPEKRKEIEKEKEEKREGQAGE